MGSAWEYVEICDWINLQGKFTLSSIYSFLSHSFATGSTIPILGAHTVVEDDATIIPQNLFIPSSQATL